MRKILFVVIVLSFLFPICGQMAKASTASQEPKAAAKEASKPQEVGNNICPVSGEKIDEKAKATYEYKGKVYSFCCAGCIEEFKKDPEKYIKKIEEQMMEGTGNTE